ncbi:hypothetical protein D0894_10010 [Pseudomonas monteilii]|uniref:Uncharacterized protein n=1 Tax=Pseudomonas monteilii TaxID=76759 RepID=A0A399M8I4_9PSED|nr:hypothetical protein D0894_10010 [Pseudomonas monteilii]
MISLYGPLRGHARSHRDRTAPEGCAEPVGAGVPAKRPVKPIQNLNQCSEACRRSPSGDNPKNRL